MPFKILDHTADIRIVVESSTLPKLFEEALYAMNFVLKTSVKNGKVVVNEITVSGNDTTVLLINFLNEVLSLSCVNNVIYTKVTFLEFEEKNLKALLEGVHVENFDKEIKGISFHEAEITQSNGLYKTNLIFDI